MGDRCYVSITVRRCDADKWEELGYTNEFADENPEDSDYVELIDTERNYGVSDDSDDLVPGCPMFGYHDAGGEYNAAVFAYDGKTFMEFESMGDGRPGVSCGPDGPSKEDIDAVKQFNAFYKRVLVMVLGEEEMATKGPEPSAAESAQSNETTTDSTLKDDQGNTINVASLPEFFAAARQAYGALVGSSARDDSVQGEARTRLRKALLDTTGRIG